MHTDIHTSYILHTYIIDIKHTHTNTYNIHTCTVHTVRLYASEILSIFTSHMYLRRKFYNCHLHFKIPRVGAPQHGGQGWGYVPPL